MGYTPHVLVAGGTTTAAGLARDLAMRGLEVTLVTRGALGDGSAEALLDSGARVAATDPETAASRYAESQTLRAIAGHCIEDTGGLILSPDDETRPEEIHDGCLSADIPVERIDGAAVRGREPGLAPHAAGGLAVPDARIDPFGLLVATVEDARSYGATVEERTELTGFLVDDGAVTHANLRERGGSEAEMRRFDYVVNATGSRAGHVASLAGIDLPVAVETRAALVANERPTETVLTRPGPGPRAVPFDGRCVVVGSPRESEGTSDRAGDDGTPVRGVDADAVDDLLDAAAALAPAFETARVLRAWPARRTVPRQSGDCPGEISVFDHEARDGLWGLSTVVGATLTTHRLAAERVADQVCAKFGITRECLTHAHPLPESAHDRATVAGEHTVDPNPVVCPCESVTRAEVRDAIEQVGEKEADLESIRVRTRAGMGECQGEQCAHCLAGELHPARDPEAVADALAPFLDGRWTGQRHALWGDQLAAAARTYRLHAGTLRLHPEQDSQPTDLDAFEGGNRNDTDEGPEGPRGPIP